MDYVFMQCMEGLCHCLSYSIYFAQILYKIKTLINNIFWININVSITVQAWLNPNSLQKKIPAKLQLPVSLRVSQQEINPKVKTFDPLWRDALICGGHCGRNFFLQGLWWNIE